MPANYGNVLPIRIPELNDQANIVTALTDFYYGLNSEGNQIVGASTTTSELYTATNSIAGNLQRLFTDKANYTDKLNVFALTSSSELASKISDETGSGSLVFANTPTLITPILGVATATTINQTSIPTNKTLVVTTDKLNVHASTSSSELAGIISDETGTGSLVFANTPTLVTPVLGVATATSINGTIIPTSKTLVTTDANQVTNTMLAGSITNAKLVNSKVTVGTTDISLGASSTTLAGLISVTSTSFNGDLIGNANTATSIKGGAAAQVLYQTEADKTGFVSTTYVDSNNITKNVENGWLLSYASSGPVWTNPTQVPAVNIASNLASGSLGSVPYQTESAKTGFIPPNTSSTKKFLTQTGTGSAGAQPVWETITSATSLTSFSIRDTSAAYDLSIAATSSTALTANRTLTLDVVNAARTLKLAGNLDIAGNLTTSGAYAITLTATGATSITLPTSGLLATTSNKLSAFSATTSAELAGVISDETGSGLLVFNNSPSFITPTLGAATATTINKLTITAPTTSATLTVANGKTFTASNTITLTGTDGVSAAIPGSGSVTLVTTASTTKIAADTSGNADTATTSDNIITTTKTTINDTGASNARSMVGQVFVQETQPATAAVGDLWFW